MLIAFRARMSKESGFTLIELVAAMTVFALAAGAVLTVLVAGIRTAGFSRDRTLGKDLARQRIEEMRALPFYQSYGSFARAVDLLDFYFPNMATGCPNLPGASAASPGYNATDKTFTCVMDSLPGHPRFGTRIVSQFKQTNVTGTMETVDPNEPNPLAGYAWNDAGNDLPPSRFVSVVIRTNWTVSGRPQSFQIESLMGDTRLETVITQGSVGGYLLSASTAFSDGASLSLEAGPVSNSIYRGNSATARNEGFAGSAKVITVGGALNQVTGARYSAIAPPDNTQSGKITQSSATLPHPITGIPIAFFGQSVVQSSSAKVVASPPAAKGRTSFFDNSDDDVGDNDKVALSSKNEVSASLNYLNPNKDYLSLIQRGGKRPMRVFPSCSESLTPKTVTCSSGDANQTRLGELRLVPVDFTTKVPGVSPPTPPNGYLIEINFDDIRVLAKAKAANETGATAEAQTRFVGTLSWYSWRNDTGVWTNNQVCIKDATTAASSPCAGGTTTTLPDPGTSCVVFRGTCDIPLSNYIASWTRLFDGTRSISADSTSVDAFLSGVLNITTQPTNPSFPNSGYIVSIGQLRAQAVDKR